MTKIEVPNEHDIGDYISSHVPFPWPEATEKEIQEVLEVRAVVEAAIEWALSQVKVNK